MGLQERTDSHSKERKRSPPGSWKAGGGSHLSGPSSPRLLLEICWGSAGPSPSSSEWFSKCWMMFFTLPGRTAHKRVHASGQVLLRTEWNQLDRDLNEEPRMRTEVYLQSGTTGHGMLPNHNGPKKESGISHRTNGDKTWQQARKQK